MSWWVADIAGVAIAVTGRRAAEIANAALLVAATAVVVLTVLWAACLTFVNAAVDRPFRARDYQRVLERGHRLSLMKVVQASREASFATTYMPSRALAVVGGGLPEAIRGLERCARETAVRPKFPLLRGRFELAGEVRLQLGVVLLKAGRFEEAEACFHEVTERVKTMDRWLLAVRCLALAEAERGMFASAHLHADHALALARTTGNATATANGLRTLGQIAYAQGQWRHARRLLLRSIDELPPATRPNEGHDIDLVETMRLLAVVTAHDGDLTVARTWWQRAQGLIDDRHVTVRPELGARGQFSEAVILRLEGEPERALELARRAATRATDTNTTLVWAARTELARAARDLGDLALAQTTYLEVIAWLEHADALTEAALVGSELDALA